MATRNVSKKPAPSALTPIDRRFCEEYVVDLNGTAAYMRARPGIAAPSARSLANRLLTQVHIQRRVAELQQELRIKTSLDAETVVKEAWNIILADPRELVEHRVGCCRHCWGEGFGYQSTDAEYREAKAAHAERIASASDPKLRKRKFQERGGPGFHAANPPNPDCPACGGDGIGRVLVKDTRGIGREALSLLAGVKQTEKGIEVKMHDKGGAMDKVMRHLGIYNDKLVLKPFVSVKDMTGKANQLPGEGDED